MGAQKLLFPDLDKHKSRKDRNRDPWGRYDTMSRFKAYEQKIERLRATIKYLTSVTTASADAIRKRDMEIEKLKNIINNRDNSDYRLKER